MRCTHHEDGASQVTLDVLCISRVDACSLPFINKMREMAAGLGARFILAADGSGAYNRSPLSSVLVRSLGYFESALDQALVYCQSDYILRLDDDECMSPAMFKWLQGDTWQDADHWEFPRTHVWADGVLMTPQLFPDYQTRLSIKAKAGGRYGVHAGSPFGGGERASVALEHHKFVVKDHQERRRIAESYDTYQLGYGTGNMMPFSLPEDAYRGQKVRVVAQGDGSVPWTPAWEREEQW